jgi:hypothetical protein
LSILLVQDKLWPYDMDEPLEIAIDSLPAGATKRPKADPE